MHRMYSIQRDKELTQVVICMTAHYTIPNPHVIQLPHQAVISHLCGHVVVKDIFRMVRPQYTPQQRSYLVSTYHRTNSVAQTRRLFANEFPNVRVPHRNTITKNVHKFSTHGTSQNRNKQGSGRPKSGRSVRNIQAVHQAITNNPRISTRRNPLPNISRATFNRITNKDLNMFPYRIQARHALLNADLIRRQNFCRWFTGHNQAFVRYIVVGDEASFHINGKVNSWNTRSYAVRRHGPRDFVYDVPNSREKITVWIGLVGNGTILGPHFFEGNVNGINYLAMINNHVVPELYRIFGRRADGGVQRAWWFQDGAPAHRRNIVRDRLQALFQDRVVGLGHAHEWPPRSPDLTPLDFFLWGYLKSKVYQTVPRNLNDLRQRITREVTALRRLHFVRRAFNDMRARAQRCLVLQGAQVEGRSGQV